MSERDGAPAVKKQRVSASARKELMLATAMRMARDDGVGTLTLARLAAACDVSKPIAYQHFTSLQGLFRAMYERIGAEYEERVRASIEEHRDGGASRAEAVRVLCGAYVDCSLANSSLQDEIGAALLTAGAADRTVRHDDAERYAGLVAGLLAMEQHMAYALTVGFLGAADRLCAGVLEHRIDRAEAVSILERFLSTRIRDDVTPG